MPNRKNWHSQVILLFYKLDLALILKKSHRKANLKFKDLFNFSCSSCDTWKIRCVCKARQYHQSHMLDPTFLDPSDKHSMVPRYQSTKSRFCSRRGQSGKREDSTRNKKHVNCNKSNRGRHGELHLQPVEWTRCFRNGPRCRWWDFFVILLMIFWKSVELKNLLNDYVWMMNLHFQVKIHGPAREDCLVVAAWSKL